MYSSERAKQVTKKDIAYLAAGIEDNVQLVGAKLDKSTNGNNFIEIKFEKDGKMLTHTEWEPLKGEKTQEKFQETCDNQFSRMEQILKCFYPNPADRVFTGDNFSQFAEWLVNMINSADKTILVRTKIVYNNSGYTTLPKYAKYTFIEPMSLVNENKSVIVKLGIDLFEKPVVADVETQNTNPLNSSFTVMNATLDNTNANPNGLPF